MAVRAANAYLWVMADPAGTEPDDRDPEQADLARRSAGGAVSPWLIIGLLAMLGVGVYAVSALL